MKTPTFNVFQLPDSIKNQTRLKVVSPSGLPDYMDAFASREVDTIYIVVFNYNKDRNLNSSMTFNPPPHPRIHIPVVLRVFLRLSLVNLNGVE